MADDGRSRCEIVGEDSPAGVLFFLHRPDYFRRALQPGGRREPAGESWEFCGYGSEVVAETA